MEEDAKLQEIEISESVRRQLINFRNRKRKHPVNQTWVKVNGDNKSRFERRKIERELRRGV